MPFQWMSAQGNLLSLCRELPSMFFNPALDVLTPYAQAIDGRPATPIRFGTKVQVAIMRGAMNFLANSDFETLDLADWIVGAGASVRTTTGGEVSGGTASLKFTPGSGNRYQDAVVPAGIPFTLLATLRGDGTNSAYVQVTNLDTGRYLTSAGAWAADTPTAVAVVNNSAAYVARTLSATVEPYATTGRYLTRLRVIVQGEAVNTFADDVILRPHFNFIGIFGHSLTGAGAFQSGTPAIYTGQVPRWGLDAAEYGWIIPGGGLIANGIHAHVVPSPNTWITFATPKVGHLVEIVSASDQFANYPLVSYGELVVGYVEDLVPALFPMSGRVEEPGQIRNELPSGDVYAYNSGPGGLREIMLRFKYSTDAQGVLLRDRLYAASRGGADGVILVPPANLASQIGCIYGLPDADFSFTVDEPLQGAAGIGRSASLRVRELPAPETPA